MSQKEKGRLKKLYYFFKPLSENRQKWRSFREFLVSPLHINSRREGEILDYVGEVLHLDGRLAEDALCEKVFPDKARSKAVRNHLRRRLTSLLDHYYLFESTCTFTSEPGLQMSLLIRCANQRQWDEQFLWLYQKKAQKVMQQLPKNEEYFLRQMELSAYLDSFVSRQQREAAAKDDRYLEELGHLNHFFAISQLKLACNLLNQQSLFPQKKQKKIPLLQALLHEIEHNWEDQELLVRLYYLIYRGLEFPGEDSYFLGLMDLLRDPDTHFGRQEDRWLFQHATNLCTRRYNLALVGGEARQIQKYQAELLDLYNFKLSRGILFHYSEGVAYIDHGDFKNIVLLFCRVGAFDWVRSFIETYSGQVLKKFAGIVKNFAEGILLFFQEDFPQAERHFLRVLQELKVSYDQYYALSVKGYYLRVLYEQGKWEDCEREARNATKAIRRIKGIPRSEVQKALQLTLYIQELCRASAQAPDNRQLALQRLHARVQTGKACLSRDWLLQKTRTN